ncbi:MAG: TPM domain-containing protein [Nitrospirae bacterium]|nr:TPM domain-containing protein [Nitrospirota bacterium]
MMLSNWAKTVLACLLFFFVAAPAISAVSEIPASPSEYVVDLAGIVDDATKSRLNSSLHELEEKTTVQMVILTVKGLDGLSIEDVSIKTVEKWKLGQKGKDNGILLLVSMGDKKYRFEIGYGLEQVLPDSLVGSLGRSYLVPNFRKGDYGAGIAGAAFAVMRTIASAQKVELSGAEGSEAKYIRKPQKIGLLHQLLILFFLIIVVIVFIKNPSLFMLLYLFSGGRGGGGGWSGGGGFGGGGGGGFGGGGASGGW